MATLREAFKRGGGGFLNDVDAVITGLRWTTNPDFGGDAPTESTANNLWAALSTREDGSEDSKVTHLFAGSSDDFVIHEDGETLTPVNGALMWGGTAWDRFYGSFVDGGGDDIECAEDGTLNFGHIVGKRARFAQVKDEAAMKRMAKRATTSRGKYNSTGQQRGKDGKYYDIRTVQISKVYAGEPTARVSQTPAKSEASIAQFAAETLVAILNAQKSRAIDKNKLNFEVTRLLMAAKDPRHETVRKFLYEDANLGGLQKQGLITYDPEQRVIRLARVTA